MSDPDDSMDAMVAQASTPSLATLFRKAKKAGVIDAAVPAYGGTKFIPNVDNLDATGTTSMTVSNTPVAHITN